jgi:hypothetical protein
VLAAESTHLLPHTLKHPHTHTRTHKHTHTHTHTPTHTHTYTHTLPLASLRKGEVPDEISRDAEKLTSVFEAEAAKAGSVGAGEVGAQLGKAGKALDAYVVFAKIVL